MARKKRSLRSRACAFKIVPYKEVSFDHFKATKSLCGGRTLKAAMASARSLSKKKRMVVRVYRAKKFVAACDNGFCHRIPKSWENL